MSLILQGSTSGSITLQEPAVAGSTTINLPATSGTLMVSGNMPTFNATNSGVQTFSVSTWTKILFQTENWDTNSNFASSTFTPTIAGYYLISTCLNHEYAGSSASAAATSIYKNGSLHYTTSYRFGSSVGVFGGMQASTIVYFNGSTDYVEIYAWSNNGSPQINVSGTGGSTIFTGTLLRTA